MKNSCTFVPNYLTNTNMKKTFLLFFIMLIASYASFGQKVGIKTNLLYDATATINLGVEFGLGERTTLDVSGNYSGWMFNKEKNTSYKHWLIQPEFRYWLCDRFIGHFVGVHAGYTAYDWSNTVFSNARYDGTAFGAGLSYGYQFYLGKHWNLETTLGLGYALRNYDRYNGLTNVYEGKEKRGYWGPTKAGITLIYLIK